MTAAFRLPAVTSWLLPSGEIVESPFQPEGAVPSPITQADLEWLHDYACRDTTRIGLMFLTYPALHGRYRNAGCPTADGWQRVSAVRQCATQLEMLRATGMVP